MGYEFKKRSMHMLRKLQRSDGVRFQMLGDTEIEGDRGQVPVEPDLVQIDCCPPENQINEIVKIAELKRK